MSVSDPAGMTEVRARPTMTGWGVLRQVEFCGREIQPGHDEAKRWLATVVPFRADAEVVAYLTGGGVCPGISEA